MITVIVIEDSDLAREGLVSMLTKINNITIVAQANNANIAREAISKHQPDLIFLDIHMPGESGLDLLDSIEKIPNVIFTTAYAEYAIRSFDFPTVDYLLKPIRQERLQQAIDKYVAQKTDHNKLSEKLEADHRMFIKDGDQCDIVAVGDISCFESCKNYTVVYFNQQKSFIRKNLSQIEKRLPEKLFFRASRQYIINLKNIQKIEEWINDGFIVTLLNNKQVELSRRQAQKLKELLSF